jgi:peptide/nickel transport system substrate-binding protein
VRCGILGPLVIWEDERELDLGSGRHRALLVFLLLHAGEVVSSDRLVDELWDERAPASAAKLVQGYVSRLRRALPPDSIVTRDSGYLLRTGESDGAEFEQLLELASEQPAREAGETLRGALALWRGRPLAEFEYESWAQAEIARLQELRLVALEERIAADLQLGGADRVVPELEALVAEHPLRERLRAELMLALYRSGRQADALATFADARRLLVDELGIEPGPELQEMQRRILAHDPELMSPPRARPPLTPRRRTTLLAAALAGVLAAAVAVPIFALSSGGSGAPRATTRFVANAVGAVDLSTDHIVGSVPLGAAPSSIAYGKGSVWVTMPNQDAVWRIDPTTQTVRQTIPAGNGPAAIAVGDGFVWVANSLGGTVWQIDPRKNGGQVVDQIPVGNGPTGVAYGLGGVWVANSIDRTVVRIDPLTSKPGRPIPIDAGADAIAVGDAAVWVTSESTGILSRLDPGTGSVTTIGVGNGPVAVAVGAGAVWVANSQDGTVSRVDPRTARVTDLITVGEGPSGIAIASGTATVWVSNELAGTLSKIDPAADRADRAVKTVAVGHQPQGVAVGADAAYVAVQGSSSAHRGGTLTLAVPNPSGFYEVAIPKSLDPANGLTAWELLTMTNDGLVGYGRSGGSHSYRIVPDLAVAMPTVSDGDRTYTFRMRRGIRYSTGSLVRPADIRRGIERTLVVGGGDAPNSYLAGIVGARRCVTTPKHCDLSKGIVADLKSNTVTFHLTGPDPDFLYKLALPIADAVPANTPLEARLPLPATGPYEIAGYNAKLGVIRLVRNPRFQLWSAAAQPDGYPDQIVERYGYTGTSAVHAVERGTADITAAGPDQTWASALASSLRTRYSSRLYSAAVPVATTAVWLNTRLAPFNDVRVRRALNYAVDRDHLINLAGGPAVAQLGCQLLPPNTDGYRRYCPFTLHPDHAGTYNGPDLAKARQLAAASGTRGQPVTVWFYDIRIGRLNGSYLVSVLRSLGYNARLRLLAHNAANGSTWRRDRQAGVSGLGTGFPSADSFFSEELTCRSYDPAQPNLNFNPAAFCDRRIDTEIARARALQTSDQQAASRLWTMIDHQITDEAPWVVIRTTLSADFVSRRTGNHIYCYLPSVTGSTGACLDQLWVR